MRCFVAAWPTGSMVEALEGFDRPTVDGLRWTTADQWHVTLRFLGEVPDTDIAALTDALTAGLSNVAPMTASAGPATRELGGQLVVPVAGVDDLAAVVVDASRPFGDEPERRRFRGHLTLARVRRGGELPRTLLRQPIAGAWPVASVVVVRSHLDSGGARYEELARIELTASIQHDR